MRYLLCLLAGLFVHVSYGQLSTGTSGLTVLPGTILSYDGLVLTPGTNLTIANNVLTKNSTPETSGTLNSISRVFVFTSPVIFTGDVAVRYQAGELNGNTEALMQVAHNPAISAGSWTISAGSTRGVAGSYVVSNSFSGITVGRVTAFNPSVTLPIVLEKFEGTVTGTGNLLSWITSLETNVQEIQLQRSPDGISYVSIANFAPTGVSSSYSYVDRSATGVQYYRLKTIDIDGSFSYSPVVRLSNDGQEYKLLVSPNPTSAQLIITSPVARGQVVVHNVYGQKILQQSWQQGQVVDVSQLPAGTYMVTLISGQRSFAGKILKQ